MEAVQEPEEREPTLLGPHRANDLREVEQVAEEEGRGDETDEEPLGGLAASTDALEQLTRGPRGPVLHRQVPLEQQDESLQVLHLLLALAVPGQGALPELGVLLD